MDITAFDRLPPDEGALAALRVSFGDIASFYNFDPVTLSTLEEPKFFSPMIKHGILAERPPVILKSGTGQDVALRFSSALSSLRAYKAYKMYELPQPVKFLHTGMNFFMSSRKEEGIRASDEQSLMMIGEQGPIAEAQITQVIWKWIMERGFTEVMLSVAAPGCSQCHPHFRSSFSAFLRGRAAGLCKNCKRSFKTNPTRVLVCEEDKCSQVASHSPQILDFLCEACKKHLKGYLEFLDEMRIPYYLDSRRFRLGSWWNTLICEFVYTSKAKVAEEPKEAIPGEEIVAKDAPETPQPAGGKRLILAEVGRMTKAADLLGAKNLEAVAGVVFHDTVASALYKEGRQAAAERPDIFLAQLGELARRKSLKVLEILRLNNFPVRESLGRDAIKSQLKVAEKIGAALALIVGQKEALDDTIIIREVDSGIQETVPQEKLIDFLKRRLRK